MIDRLAKQYGMALHETPVGFNHIADWMLKEDVLIGGEESGGISFKGHIPEGDGVIMGLLIVEMVAKSGGSLVDLIDGLLEKVGPAYYERRDMRLKHPVAKDKMTHQLTENARPQLAVNRSLKYVRATGLNIFLTTTPGY
jgi:phosphomannomutase